MCGESRVLLFNCEGADPDRYRELVGRAPRHEALRDKLTEIRGSCLCEGVLRRPPLAHYPFGSSTISRRVGCARRGERIVSHFAN